LLEDRFVVSAWNAWCRWKRFGLPHGKGWMAERNAYIRAIEIIEQEQDFRVNKEQEK